MILDSLTLFDFGLYAGQQTIELTPASAKKPVILFGGLNGGGKTTFLDAINLVLYGNRAKTSNRNGLAYPDYLRECIHQGVNPSDGAWIELRFRNWADGNEHTYLVNRSWRSTGAGIKEELEVRVDGKYDRALTESWSDHVEGFLPLGLSRLFLFDGEKIEALADLEHSKEALGTAMASLLGLDVVDQLSVDLVTLEQRKRIALKAAGDRAEIETLQERVKEHETRIQAQGERRAQLETELDQRKRRVRQLEEEFRKQGGEAFQNREAYRAEASSLEQRIQECEAALVEEASGPLPLLMAKQLLEGLSHQAAREALAAEVATLVETLKERDQELMDLLDAKGTSKKVLTELVGHLEKDRRRRVVESETEVYLGFSAEAQQLLAATLQPALPESAQRATRTIAQLRDLQEAHLQVERKLQAVPDEDAIRGYVETLEKARIEEQLAQSQRDALVLEMEEASRLLDRDKDKLSRLIEDAVGTDFGREDDQRVAGSAARVRDTLRDLRSSIVKRNIGRIEAEVMTCFKSVLRKKRLIDKATIDPETFGVELRRSSGKVLSPDRLSAGERQLFAVSLLWGLARASGRPIPTIIDTPLGRLDGTHREHLVDRYFPHASHQVILLSTNKEIDREYYASLKPFIGREYLLDFDEDAGKTTVREGYFW